jgi:hypothetical protein
MNRREGFDDWQLRDHHWRGQYGYGRNFAAPRSHHFLEWLDWQREHTDDTALSPDHARCTRIDLQFAPQPQDLNIDAPIEGFSVNSVGGLQQNAPVRAAAEVPREMRATTHTHPCSARPASHWDRGVSGNGVPAASRVESIPTSLRVTGTGNAPNFLPPQYGTDAGKQLSEAEGLYDIVVRSEFEADDAIDFVGAMAGRDDDGNL